MRDVAVIPLFYLIERESGLNIESGIDRRMDMPIPIFLPLNYPNPRLEIWFERAIAISGKVELDI